MATISFGAAGAARTVTQGVSAVAPGPLAPHMEKCVVAAGQVFRVIPPYACDTWEIKLAIGATGQAPVIRIFGLDDDYVNTATAPATSTPVVADGSTVKWEVPNDTTFYTKGTGFVAADDLPHHLIWDHAWKALQFDVTTGSALIKVKAYRAGKCTFEGSYITGASEAS